MAASEVPIMCTLPTDDLVRRLAEFEELFAEALTGLEREPLRLRLTFDAGREATVRELVAAEQRCCAFLGYAVRRAEAGLVVEVTAPREAGPEQTLGGHRLYPEQAVTVLRVIKTAQRLGFTLDEVAELLEAARPRHGRRPGAGPAGRVRAKPAEVERRIADLEAVRSTLREAVGAGCGDLLACAAEPRCPLPFTEPGAGAERRP